MEALFDSTMPLVSFHSMVASMDARSGGWCGRRNDDRVPQEEQPTGPPADRDKPDRGASNLAIEDEAPFGRRDAGPSPPPSRQAPAGAISRRCSQ